MDTKDILDMLQIPELSAVRSLGVGQNAGFLCPTVLVVPHPSAFHGAWESTLMVTFSIHQDHPPLATLRNYHTYFVAVVRTVGCLVP